MGHHGHGTGWHEALRRDPDALVGAQVDRRLLRRVWAFARSHRRTIFVYLATIAATTVVATLPPLVFRAIIDDHAIPRADVAGLNRLALLALGLAAAEVALNLAQRWLSARIGEGLIYDLRVALYTHVQRLPVAFFTRTQTGSLISRLNNDVQGAQRAFTTTLGSAVQNALTVVVTLAIMIGLEWRLTLLALAVVPAFLVPAKRVGRRMQRLTAESYALTADMHTTMTERFNVSGAQLVKLFGTPDNEVGRFSERAGKVRDIGVRTALLSRVFFASLGLLAAAGTVLVYWLGTRLAISGDLTVGTLSALALYVGRLYGPLTQLTNTHVDVMAALVSFERVFEVLDHQPSIVERAGSIDLLDCKGQVSFEGVSFQYPSPASSSIASLEAPDSPGGEDPSAPVLTDISFVAEPGQTVALVGPTGAGKTSLCQLVPRLYDVTSGVVRIDGHDVRDLTLQSLAAAIGVVPQDPHLFHDSIAANLLYARPGATRDELVQACRRARIHDLITSLPDGYETLVGERGYRLSGGEKQRLALARVLLKGPAIVILDEATAHLDSDTEAQVRAALDEVLTGRTVLVIAHRLSTIVSADEILVVDRGRIVQRGTHAELMAAGGLYRDLYSIQHRAEKASEPPGEVPADGTMRTGVLDSEA